MTDDKGPYKYELAFVGAEGGGWRIVGPHGNEPEVYGRKSFVVDIVNHRNIGYYEGRKAAEKNLNEWLGDQTNDEEKIRDLARPFLGDFCVDGDSDGVPGMVDIVEDLVKLLRGKGVPPYKPSLDEKELEGLIEKGTNAWAGHVEEKGPYSWDDIQGPMVFGPTVPDRNGSDGKFYTSCKRAHCEKLANALNLAFQAGRASRDGLREAVKQMILNWDYDGRAMLEMAQKALEAEGEGECTNG